MIDRCTLAALSAPVAALALICGGPACAQQPVPSVELGGHKMHQLALTTTDLQRAIRFYRDTLGLPFEFEANGMAFFDVAGIRLMLALDPLRTQAPPTSILYFDTPDFNATHNRLVATDITLEGPIETVQRTRDGDLRIQQFRDPDGNVLAIMGLVAGH